MNKIILSIVLLLTQASLAEQMMLDTSMSYGNWYIQGKKGMIHGNIHANRGVIEYDGKNVTKGAVVLNLQSIKIASIKSRAGKKNFKKYFLKNLHKQNNGEAYFEFKKMKKNKNGDVIIDGKLQLLDKTKTISLSGIIKKTGIDGHKFNLKTKIDPNRWGIDYQQREFKLAGKISFEVNFVFRPKPEPRN